MELQLRKKTVFISGSTSGIGFAMAQGFLSEGSAVTIHGRTQKSVDGALSELKKLYPESKVKGIHADFNSPTAMESIKNELSTIDILINNLGIFASKTFAETNDTDWNSMFQVNVMSGVQLSRYFLPKMMTQNWGRILFISSECAQLVPEDLIAYSSTKAALLSLSKGLAQTTKGTNITVNTLLPGSTLTGAAVDFLEGKAKKEGKTTKEVTDDFFKVARPTSLLQRFAQPKEIADMALFLSSPLSSATNGSAIKVDGGSIPGIL